MSVSWACSALFGNTTQYAIANSYFQGTYVNAGSVPAKPSGVTATASSYNKIIITWKDNSTNETGFEVYRSTTSTGTFNMVGLANVNATSYADSGLASTTTYLLQNTGSK